MPFTRAAQTQFGRFIEETTSFDDTDMPDDLICVCSCTTPDCSCHDTACFDCPDCNCFCTERN